MKSGGRHLREIIAVGAVVFLLILLDWRIWITRKDMMSHDSICWFGIFQYFSDCLQQGFLPLWDPYSNAGVVFYPNIGILHLWDPQTIFLIFLGKLFRVEMLTLYHWDLLLRYLIFICGAYLFFRHVARHRVSAWVAFITLAFSSLSLTYLRQHAFILAFYLFPWVLFFILTFLEKPSLRRLVGVVFFLGLTLNSYHAMFSIASLTILLLYIAISRGLPKPSETTFFKKRGAIIICGILFLLLVIQVYPLYLTYTHDLIPTVRMFEAPVAARSFPADFCNLLMPNGFLLHFFDCFMMSEALLYVGILPLILAAAGILFGRHKYKIGFILTGFSIALLMLGDGYFLYNFLFKFFPFFSIIRNTHTFSTVFIFCLGYFVCIGTDTLFGSLDTRKFNGLYDRLILFMAVALGALGVLINIRIFQTLPRWVAKGVQIFNGSALPLEGQHIEMLMNYINQGIRNLLMFLLAGIFLIYILKNSRIRSQIKYAAVLLFITVDLMLVHLGLYPFMTMPRLSQVYSHDLRSFEDSRFVALIPRYPFYAFLPALHKKFTAYGTYITNMTTHFYELKNYFTLVSDTLIPRRNKDMLLGVTVPRLRLVAHYASVLKRGEIRPVLARASVKTLQDTVFLEEEVPAQYAHLKNIPETGKSEPAKGSIGVASFSPNEVIIDVDSADDAFLCYGDGFDRAWRVFVDNAQRKVYRANLAFKAVIVDKGTHRVRFVYDPRLYRMSIFCYFAGLLGCAVLSLAKK